MAGGRFSLSFPGNLSNCSQIPWSQGYKYYLPGIQVMVYPEIYVLHWLILPGDAYRSLRCGLRRYTNKEEWRKNDGKMERWLIHVE